MHQRTVSTLVLAGSLAVVSGIVAGVAAGHQPSAVSTSAQPACELCQDPTTTPTAVTK